MWGEDLVRLKTGAHGIPPAKGNNFLLCPRNQNGAKSFLGKVQSVSRASPGGSAVKNPPAMQETRVRSLGWEDALEKEMATHTNILAWRIP